MRVLVISHAYPSPINEMYGNFVHRHACELTRLECEVRVLAPAPWVPPWLIGPTKWRDYRERIPLRQVLDGIAVERPRYLVLPRRILYGWSGHFMTLALRGTVKNIIRKFTPDIVHAYSLVPDGYAAVQLSSQFGVPTVCTSYGDDANSYPQRVWRYRHAARRAIEQSQAVIAVSKPLAQVLCSLGTPRNGPYVVSFGVNTEIFRPRHAERESLRRERGISPDAKVLIYLGWIHRNKGVFELIDALSRLVTLQREILLVMVGGGPDHAALSARIASRDLEQYVRLVGFVPDDEVARWLNLSDVFVLPSYAEGTPSALLEAMSSGLVSVATRIGGIPDVMPPDESCRLCEPRSVDSLFATLQELVTLPATELRLMGMINRQYMVANYSWRRSAELTLDVYHRVLSKHG